jgi:hypothetical protein
MSFHIAASNKQLSFEKCLQLGMLCRPSLKFAKTFCLINTCCLWLTQIIHDFISTNLTRLLTDTVDVSLMKIGLQIRNKFAYFQRWKHQFSRGFFQHWKWNAFSLICHIFNAFFHQQWKRYKIQISKAGNAEYFKHAQIYGITFGILWMKSQYQPDFTNNFFTREVGYPW